MDIKLTSVLLLEISIPDADASKPSRVYQLSAPSWASYEEAKEICSAFSTGFDEMKAKNDAAREKLKAEEAESITVDSQPSSDAKAMADMEGQ